MSSTQKKSIVVVAIIVLLYASLTIFGLLKTGDRDERSNKASFENPRWAALLNKMLSPFTPRVKLTTLTCDGKKVNEYFDLSHSFPDCTIPLGKGMDGQEDFWKTDIVISSQNKPKPQVYFLAKYPANDDGSDPDLPRNCKEKSLEKIDQAGWLGIELTPKNEENIVSRCWLKSDNNQLVGLTLIGPTELRIFCWECTKDNKKRIKLRLDP